MDLVHHIEVVLGDITNGRCDARVREVNSRRDDKQATDREHESMNYQHRHSSTSNGRQEFARQLVPVGNVTGASMQGSRKRWLIETQAPHRGEYAPWLGAGLLRACHVAAMSFAERHNCMSISFPAIACTGLGWTAQQTAPIAIDAVHRYWKSQPASELKLVRFVMGTAANVDAYKSCLDTDQEHRTY